MKIILVSGGSGGHIYPCIELAKYLKDKGNEILLVGSKNSMEEVVYKESNMNYVTFNITKKKVKTFIDNYKNIENIYDKFKPDIVILFGNYISFSFALLAKKRGINIYLHEQNVIYGKANKLLGMFSKRIYLSFPIKNNIYKKKSLLVGNPKSDCNELKDVYLPRSKKNVFIVMGSLGSSSVNKILLELINDNNALINYHIVTGKKHYEHFINNVNKKNNVFIYSYINDLSSYISKCDLFISRSGATTLSEIVNLSITSILIPSPYVKNNHQYKNAKYLYDNNACLLIEEKYLNSNLLKTTIDNILNDDEKKNEFKRNLAKLSIKGSKERIYEDILSNEK